MNDVIANAIGQLGLGVASNAIWHVAEKYFSSTNVPTQKGMIQLLATEFGSQISTEQSIFLASKIFEAKVTNGAQINMREGIYQGGGSSIVVGKGAGITMSGNASIKAT